MMVLKICTGTYVFHENWDINIKVVTWIEITYVIMNHDSGFIIGIAQKFAKILIERSLNQFLKSP